MAGLSAGAFCFQPDHSRPASLESLASGQPQCGPSPIVAIIVATAAGLLVVSTRVGGVPEVLPADMLLLAEPSPEGLVGAVGAALLRVGAGGADPWEQHAAVRSMYSWQSIAQRTERVYRGVLREARHDSAAGSCGGMVARLRRYHKCGKWFGKICCCITGAGAGLGRGLDLAAGSIRLTHANSAQLSHLRLASRCCECSGTDACDLSIWRWDAAVDWLYWHFLEWWQPADSLEAAPDFPTFAAAAGGRRLRD